LDDYRVRLDAYNGPMDLLLYLIRKEEVDIYDIPIARIAEQYHEYLELLQALDVNLAGEFLLLAATLMEIKSRMLLPHPPPLAEGEEEDPRMELVRELLEYKRFRDAAEGLKERAEVQQLKFPRLARPEVPAEEPSAKPLHEVELWDIFAAFRKLMQETLGPLPRTILYDDVPVSEFMDRVLEQLRQAPSLRFWDLFAGRRDRLYVVGTFLALLELIRSRRVLALQEGPFGDIHLQLRPGEEGTGRPAEGTPAPPGSEQGPAGTPGAGARQSDAGRPGGAPAGGPPAAQPEAPDLRAGGQPPEGSQTPLA
jgi:segregation and condensation protein A